LSNTPGAVFKQQRTIALQLSSKFTSQPKLRHHLLVLGVIYALIGAAANAQNLDQGKSAMLLFADSCATCHRSARGLAKGRFRPTLFLFLQEHYATNSSTAWDLASYLASVDSPRSGRSQPAARKPSHVAAPRSPIRPPMPLPSNRSN
jgi:cytochrome c